VCGRLDSDVLCVLFVTAEVFKDTFRSLQYVNPAVVYPIPDFSMFGKDEGDASLDNILPDDATTVFLSINRYERKKNLPLAIEAFGKFWFSILIRLINYFGKFRLIVSINDYFY